MQQAYQVFKKQMEKKKKVKNKRQQNLLYSRTAFKNLAEWTKTKLK